MIKEEIEYVLTNIETEILDLVNFVRNVEKKYKEKLPKADIESDRIALSDAFGIVKTLLFRICALIDDFPSTHTENSITPDTSWLPNFYRAQYSYQIAHFLVSLLEENLHKFSDKLDELARPADIQQKIKSPTQRQPKKPKKSVCFNCQNSEPSTALRKDNTLYEHSRKRIHKHTVKLSTSDSEDEDYSDYSSHNDSKHPPVISFEEYVEDYGTLDTLVNVTKILSKLISVLNELTVYLNNGTQILFAQTPEKSLHSKAKTLEQCCSISCKSCCGACRHLHKKSKGKDSEFYKRNISSWHKDMLPIIDMEPFWLETPYHHRKDKPSSCSSLNTEKKSKLSRHGSEDDSSQSSEENYKRQEVKDDSPQFPSNICPEKVNKTRTLPNLTGNQFHSLSGFNEMGERRTTGLTKRKRSVKGKLAQNIPSPKQREQKKIFEQRKQRLFRFLGNETAAYLGNKKVKTPFEPKEDDKVSTESDYKPTLAKKLDQMIYCEGQPGDKLGGFYIAPAENPEDDQKDKYSSNETYSYPPCPNKIVFNILKFSALIRERYISHFSKAPKTADEQELSSILDILLTSASESIDFGEEVEPKESDKKKPSAKSSFHKDTETEDDEKPISDKDVERFVDNVLSVATQVSQVQESTPSPKLLEKQDEYGEVDVQLLKRKDVSQACDLCKDSLPTPISSKDKHLQSHNKAGRDLKSPNESCQRCWNACQRGLTIHQCHDTLPSGILEIRHLNEAERICVCFQIWDRKKELEDWRWQKNPYFDPTRVELEQEASVDKDPVVKVIYGPEWNMVKESLAETELKIVSDYPQAIRRARKSGKQTKPEKKKAVSRTYLELSKKSKKISGLTTSEITSKPENVNVLPAQQSIVCKLCRFFDDIQKVGYGKGPPLVMKIRRKTALNDAYNILMAPSRIKLNYYRSLRVIFLSENSSKITSSTNFIDEDQSDELFDIFARKLFSNGELCLFEHPSEETNCLYFNPWTPSHQQWFAFAGTVLALSILHQKQMDVKLALCLFKCLLDRPLTLYDLREIDPLFYQKLTWLKHNDVNTRPNKMMFTIRDQSGSKFHDKELIKNGRREPVTESNKFKYIELAVKWKLAERCLIQLKDFRIGFAAVLDVGFLTIFSEKELQNLIRQPLKAKAFLSESNSGRSSSEITRRETW